MKFRDLKVGDVFRFSSEFKWPYSGMKKGPWKKLSARKYVHMEDKLPDGGDFECRVGSINVEVSK